MPEREEKLGLALSGGGALAAWQAAFLERVVAGGMEFSRVLGFSAGSLNGAAYCLGRLERLMDMWARVGRQRLFSPSIRFPPLSLCSPEPMRGLLSAFMPAPRMLRELIVVSMDLGRTAPHYARFSPDGAWDGPLGERLMASCAIPFVFPPVVLEGIAYVDGGVPGKRPVDFRALADCREVLVLEMVRPDETGPLPGWWRPGWRLETLCRRAVRSLMDNGVRSLVSLPNGPRVFRVWPSQRLEFGMLSFGSKLLAPAMELGRADAEGFLRDPKKFVV
ncbi:MAG: patatin-like phospholipase family protein [Elusimicrobiota bacterium]